jgi:hypothetical protein
LAGAFVCADKGRKAKDNNKVITETIRKDLFKLLIFIYLFIIVDLK